jgi:hypothetical protein
MKTAALTIKINSDSETSRLKLIFENEMGSDLVLHPSPQLTPKSLEAELVDIRKKMSDWANLYNSFLANEIDDKLKCDVKKIKEVWRGLAIWGRRMYRRLFDIPANNSADLAAWSQDLKECFKGRRIIIDSAVGDIPWGLLYDEEVPEELDDDFLGGMLNHFWVTSYELEVLPPYPRTRFRWQPKLDNVEQTRLTVTINRNVKGDFGSAQLAFFEDLASKLNASVTQPPLPMRLNYFKRDLLESISIRQEPQHLFYFFCHHKKGSGNWTQRGWRNFDDTTMVINGESTLDDNTLSIRELEDDEIKCFEFPPVVFLNACESAQLEIGDPTSFMLYFINVMKAYAFIGTEAAIPAALADDMGRHFVQEFLKGRPIGEILFHARIRYALECHNPFGLYYTLYGNGNVQLTEAAVKESRL